MAGKYELVDKSPILGNVAFDVIERGTTYVLPASATLYATLANIWDLPEPLRVVGTITAITVFLRVFIGMAKSSYKKSTDRLDGTLQINEDDGQLIIQPNLTGTANELTSKKEVTLVVTQGTPSR